MQFKKYIFLITLTHIFKNIYIYNKKEQKWDHPTLLSELLSEHEKSELNF